MPNCQSLKDIPGLGPKRLRDLNAAGIYQPADLLHILPQTNSSDPSQWQAGDKIQCTATVLKLVVQFIRRKGAMITVTLQHEQGVLKARFFNALYLKKQIQEGQCYRWTGTLDKKRGDTLVMPRFQKLDGDNDHQSHDYPQCPPGISQQMLAQWIEFIFSTDYLCEDPLGIIPDKDYHDLLQTLHFENGNEENWASAQKTVALRETCSYLWQLRKQRDVRSTLSALPLHLTETFEQEARALFNFTFSYSQNQAWQDLSHNINQAHPTHSLLQGDVGCGKSAVVFLAAWAALHQGLDVIYLAPTHLLAQQQYGLFAELLENSPFNATHLTREHRQLDNKCPSVYVGTHVLLQDDISLNNIGLVIIDEQHKFGVGQRQTIIEKCQEQHNKPHLCMISATPIPRSLQLSHYGDLDLITIGERPTQHAHVKTELIKQPRIDRFAKICQPVIERDERFLCIAPYLDSEHQGVLSAQRLYQQLCKDFGKELCALLHGSLSEDEQTHAIKAISTGSARILIATSVIEVGFNLPQATGMLIANSERFGLAQLHQMRGRLGRGVLNGVCYFCTPNPNDHPRLQSLLEHQDGFAIAEADLAQRGSGDLLGQRQHGMGYGYTGAQVHDLNLWAEAQGIVDHWDQSPRRQLFSNPQTT